MAKRSNKVVAWARAILVVASVITLATGVTFAALQSQQATLLNNTLSSATADLRIGTSASSFAASRTGFDFRDVVPGGPAMPADGDAFYLKNYGSAKLLLHVSVSSIPVNTDAVDLAKVLVVLSRVDTNTTQTFSLQSLVDGFVGGGSALTDSLDGGTVAQYKLQLKLAADAFTGSAATVSDIDMVFSGSGV